MLKKAIKKLVDGENLCEQEIMEAMDVIMEGNATQAQIGSFVTALCIKGETIEEITGCAKVMREKALKIKPKANYFIDTCGTGGDGTNTFNISTACAIIAASGGITVAKHGNRSVSSKSGSADVLEALGVNISLSPDQVLECIDRIGIGFMFAPSFHSSMKHAASARREIGIRTIFNILGPLTNPANATGQVMGVFDINLTNPLAMVLSRLETERAMVVHGLDGMDEITTTEATIVSEVRDGRVIEYEIYPEKFGFPRCSITDIAGGDAKKNAEIIISILNGEIGPKRNIVLIKAAAALYIGKAVNSMEDGIDLAAELIDSGKAIKKLNELQEFTNAYAQ